MATMASPRIIALLVALVVPGLAVGLYLYLGSDEQAFTMPQGQPHPGVAPGPQNAGAANTGQLNSVEEMANMLAEKLKSDPNNAQGWALLARSYVHIGRIDAAKEAYARAQALGVSDPKLEQILAEAAANPAAHDVDAMVTQLEERLGKNPDDAKGWVMLARSYYSLKRYSEAAQAFAKGEKGSEKDADYWADYADALASANERNVVGKPEELLRKALELNPNHPKALWLSGTGAMQRKDKEQALGYWRRLYALMPPESRDAQMIAATIAQLDPSGAPARVTDTAAQSTSAPAPAATVQIRGHVSLDPKLLSAANPEDTLFVFAKAASGPPMPLAVVRKQVKDLPFDFVLNDAMAMMPQMKLSNFEDVVVSARVSKSGGAVAASGDLESGKTPVNLKHVQPITLVIDQLRP